MKKLLFYSLFFFILISCGKNNSDSVKYVFQGEEVISLSKTEINKSRNLINFGITPWQSLKEHQKGFIPLLKYLSDKTGKKFVLNVSKDYDSLKEEFKKENIDIAAFSPFAYVDAVNQIPDRLKYIATTKRKFNKTIRDHYLGYIIVKKESDINSVFDLKGKTFAFVDKISTSGYLFPMLLFKKMNIDPYSFFDEVYFLGNHTKVIEAVASNIVDAGATWDGSYYLGRKKYGDVFKIIETTEPIPLDAWAASSSLPDDFIIRLRNILISINHETVNSDNEKILDNEYFPFDGFIVKDYDYYKIVKEASQLLSRNR
ncbi:MAG: phosphate/phosphite/phosphonate ABC transporter substrate-binding protein [Candidatus Mcinerneyibacterium aminivorans]|uniref:Phosphate/phosphite/phosphonate ABC transporter substrate-binding protein n=1 Tax=Candidatus Mcinerneyibacterium aminivorans TaxID=2703815 RepID=A0A5D0MCX2_9BACT|nr:MAG: phosphate/phosphite/phosphonate ABC transporter substrate-binding protein [Candidatus Mcinerneyibacterium aminivorans]